MSRALRREQRARRALEAISEKGLQVETLPSGQLRVFGQGIDIRLANLSALNLEEMRVPRK